MLYDTACVSSLVSAISSNFFSSTGISWIQEAFFIFRVILKVLTNTK